MKNARDPAPIPRDRTDDYGDEILAARRRFSEALAGRSLPHLGGAPVPSEEARHKVENLLGYAQVPIGLAGPMIVNGAGESGPVYVPMATTEGALVAACCRGMKLMNAGGGVHARVVHEGYTQNPIFVYETSADAFAASREIAGLEAELGEITAGLSRHGRLVGIEPSVAGRRLIVKLTLTTGDAAGSNMAAQAADHCSRRIAEKTAARRYFVHGQDSEKRASSRNVIEGRGRHVVAEAVVPAAVLRETARVEVEDLLEIQRAYTVGFWHLGTHNWLVQVANVLAAVFIACGQDVAYVAESAAGMLDFDRTDDGDLTASVTLPSLMIGTVGGGTGQGTAAECLDILGCRGTGRSHRFAEIVGAAILAADLSLMAAFCSHEFVAAHERLGRNRPGSS